MMMMGLVISRDMLRYRVMVTIQKAQMNLITQIQ